MGDGFVTDGDRAPSGLRVVRDVLDHDDPEYLAEHLRDALATDTRVLQPGLEVRVVRDLVVVRGCVPTEGVRAAISDVLGDLVAGRRVANEVEITPNVEPLDAEDLP